MSKFQPNGSKNTHAYATEFTRTGKVNMLNRKSYRTATQQAEARHTAVRGKDGVYRSNAPVSLHRAPKGRARA